MVKFVRLSLTLTLSRWERGLQWRYADHWIAAEVLPIVGKLPG